MKKSALLLSIALLVVTKISVAQLVADAGPDQAYCSWFELTWVVLGGEPTASGGVEPYTYSWDVDHELGVIAFIGDSTMANPYILYPPHDDQNIVQFYLTVTDAAQNESMDTVNVAFSHFMMHLGQFLYTIDQGDTLHFPHGPNIFGGFPPVEYLWRPNHGLIDSIGWEMSAAPDYSIAYEVLLMDSVGCVVSGGSFVFVSVTPVSVFEQAEREQAVHIYPNPAADIITLTMNPGLQGIITFHLFDQQGRLVLHEQLHDRQSEIDLSGLSSGVYIYKLSNGEGFEYAGKITVE